MCTLGQRARRERAEMALRRESKARPAKLSQQELAETLQAAADQARCGPCAWSSGTGISCCACCTRKQLQRRSCACAVLRIAVALCTTS